ncbi:MAG: C4-dicarboxylate TRAP transporter substrate-binding protein [Defluviicoccus sp.]|nr:C4-dicarboxylate TRAP transporter substrate-binding protein [Defluviicoccus sp.]MDE0385598.1 C4-dicarboxylate TRAP transporter substrate-binding protein [Defluviicoccus sp.]
MFRRLSLAAPVAVALAFAGQPASAAEYVYGSWNSPKNVVLTEGVAPYLEAVTKETGGSLKWKLLAGAQLFGGRATLAGIRDRIADAGGPVIPAFTRKELRAANVVYDLINASVSPVVMAGAVAETYHLDCPDCKGDFSRNNALFLANYASTRFNLLCRAPIAKASDMKGRRVRVVGALGRFLKSLGAVPVGGSPAKAVQAIQRGNLDCIAGPISWLQSFGLWDLTKHVLDAELAIQPTPSGMVVNRDAWKALSKSERAAMIKHAPSLIANITIRGYMAEDVEVRAEAKKRGVTITPEDGSMGPAFEAYKKNELKVVPELAKKDGVESADAIVKAHLANVAKWEKIHEKIGDDPDKFAQALWDEVFSKLDPDKI